MTSKLILTFLALLITTSAYAIGFVKNVSDIKDWLKTHPQAQQHYNQKQGAGEVTVSKLEDWFAKHPEKKAEYEAFMKKRTLATPRCGMGRSEYIIGTQAETAAVTNRSNMVWTCVPGADGYVLSMVRTNGTGDQKDLQLKPRVPCDGAGRWEWVTQQEAGLANDNWTWNVKAIKQNGEFSARCDAKQLQVGPWLTEEVPIIKPKKK